MRVCALGVSKTAIGAGLTVCFRVVQLFFSTANGENTLFEQSLFAMNGYAQAAFFFVPVFGALALLLIEDGFRELVVFRCESRFDLAIRLVRSITCSAFLFAVACLASGVGAVAIQGATFQGQWLWLGSMLFLQTVFFSACGLLCCAVRVAMGLPLLGYFSALVYGLWDFMAANVVGGGVPFVGWGCTCPPAQLMPPIDCIAYAGPPIAMLLFAFAVLLVAAERTDFITTRSG